MIENALQKVLGFGSKEFVGKAIAGGWKVWSDRHRVNDDYGSFNVEAILLDPDAWKAVGKVEGWSGTSSLYPTSVYDDERWRVNMHRFIDALADEESSKA